ncbi:hypothetical protein CANMA_004032 [Candida margitis]|uniref:uncharacterized protein n=1 Tax=Candida margitis TaxID=1775924 RepID=UPI002226CB84|nr:uncharacterized protein CANMA_004032 [Candida margitis]KAI5960252.1 hypothetical protein CANMA_004032 [Candida margitis]
MKLAILTSLAALTTLARSAFVYITEDITITAETWTTSTYCPETDSNEQSTTSLEENTMSEVERETSTSTSSKRVVTVVPSIDLTSSSSFSEETESILVESSTVDWTSSVADLSITSEIKSTSIESTTEETTSKVENRSGAETPSGAETTAQTDPTSEFETTPEAETTPEVESTIALSFSLEGPSSVQIDLTSTTLFEISSTSAESTSVEESSSVETSSSQVETRLQATSESSISETPGYESTLVSLSSEPSIDFSTSMPPPIVITLPPISTTTSIDTTVITLFSCSNDICSQDTRTLVLSTLIEATTSFLSSVETSEVESSSTSPTESSTTSANESSSTYTTIAALIYEASTDVVISVESSLEQVVSTNTDIKTTIFTITSCKDNSCTMVTHTTGLTTVTEDETIYTTYCPLTTSIESESSKEPLATTSYSEVVSFSASLSLAEVTIEYSKSVGIPPYSVSEPGSSEVKEELIESCSGDECLTSLAAEATTENNLSVEAYLVEKPITSDAQETIAQETESALVTESQDVTTSVAAPSTFSSPVPSVSKDVGIATASEIESHVTTIVSYNSEQDVTTTITSIIEITSHVQAPSADVEEPQTTEYWSEDVPEEQTSAIVTLAESISIIYSPEESPAVSEYQGSATVNAPILTAVFGVLFCFI